MKMKMKSRRILAYLAMVACVTVALNMHFVTFFSPVDLTAQDRSGKKLFKLRKEPLPTISPHYDYRRKAERLYISSFQETTSHIARHQWPLIVCMSTGRLGNKIHNYALCLVLQHMFPNATYVASEKLHQEVASVFHPDALLLPSISDDLVFNKLPRNMTTVVQPSVEKYDVSNYVLPAIKSVMGKKRFVIFEAYSFDLLAGYQSFLIDRLRLRDDIKNKATKFLDHSRERLERERNLTSAPTFVGVHVRRKDYADFVKTYFQVHSLPGKYYYRKCFDYYRRRIPNPTFVVCSDDPMYIKRAFKTNKDVIISVNGTPAEDLALLASCSHSIMTLGTYGFWSSFLAGGHTIFAYYEDTFRPNLPSPEELSSFKNFVGVPSF